MYPDLYLMRHGQTEWNLAGRMQGRSDSPLTELGMAQAARQSELIGDVTAERISSPQGRALRTADVVFAGKEFRVDSRLCEIDVGEFTGHRVEELRPAHPECFAGSPLDWYDRSPGGENFTQLSVRCQSFLDDLTGPALIVTHGITLRMLRILALGLPRSRLADLPVEQGAVHVVRKAAHEVWR
ncbi:histidine phosphatase family protein [Paracoccus methylarcula]|uniref:Histidine phosphatase family protein n=1 Tax=Paracoccus methylarcula TaxID=72022 RepID=A0A3R7LLD5_9RHOB|nr:histidine phosphatase family protein [Paracoccus methylarcula]RNF35765.1 histidine phosphatase family protein [Paracoccus methylarcula]